MLKSKYIRKEKLDTLYVIVKFKLKFIDACVELVTDNDPILPLFKIFLRIHSKTITLKSCRRLIDY